MSALYDLANAITGAADLASGRRENPVAQFSTWGYRQPQAAPHHWDGPTLDGGYATTR
jgi:hypothetical protein